MVCSWMVDTAYAEQTDGQASLVHAPAIALLHSVLQHAHACVQDTTCTSQQNTGWLCAWQNAMVLNFYSAQG